MTLFFSLFYLEIDLKKMPLGRLSKEHVDKGYAVLKEIEAVLKDGSLTAKKKEKLQFITICT